MYGAAENYANDLYAWVSGWGGAEAPAEPEHPLLDNRGMFRHPHTSWTPGRKYSTRLPSISHRAESDLTIGERGEWQRQVYETL